ncbi:MULTISPECIES: hypothetical protein [unclassified Acinetobacter]|uniref:hypothetical protein n=1 Tax=unclassified Acinetobacter TaxID=196816 RepID=UPI00190BACC2|nr:MULTISPECIES: hypothetical protein [unclassified Acinetobacter]MBK0063961.1 hypothetical protein [Acinetobacter sp. S55]MBK0067246.1 hypothetical protein [Acinetobacter sp. S54]
MKSLLQNGVDRNTPRRELGLFVVPVKAGAIIRAGFMVCVDATGYAIEATANPDLIYLGRAEDGVEVASASNGEFTIQVRTHNAFFYANSKTDPVTQASFCQPCYIEDGETVAATDGTGTLSKAGRVVGIEQDGVWVE